MLVNGIHSSIATADNCLRVMVMRCKQKIEYFIGNRTRGFFIQRFEFRETYLINRMLQMDF